MAQTTYPDTGISNNRQGNAAEEAGKE